MQKNNIHFFFSERFFFSILTILTSQVENVTTTWFKKILFQVQHTCSYQQNSNVNIFAEKMHELQLQYILHKLVLLYVGQNIDTFDSCMKRSSAQVKEVHSHLLACFSYCTAAC